MPYPRAHNRDRAHDRTRVRPCVAQSVEGGLLLFTRCVVAIYFAYSTRRTYYEELLKEKKQFYLYFGVSYTLWFFALPLCVAILVGVPSISRRSTLVAVTSLVDALAYLGVVYMIWPGRKTPFFKIAPPVGGLLTSQSTEPPASQYGAIE